jgi:CubicO group peptidase (beta-lactamase class C family)
VNRPVLTLLALLSALMSTGVEAQEPADAPIGLAEATPLVEAEMRRTGTPGVSAALVRECRVVETRAWGVRDVVTRVPLTTDDVMQGASLGKPVAALALVRLSRTGRLGVALDQPLGGLGPRIGLKPPAEAAEVTLAHLLSHSAGVSQQSRAITRPPGSTFRYAGAGFSAAQALADLGAAAPLVDRIAPEIFSPLGMTRSTYVGPPVVAPGHMPVGEVLIFVLPLWLGLSIILLGGALVVARLRRKRWAVRPITVAAAVGLAALGTGVILSGPLGPPAFLVVAVTASIALATAALGALAARAVPFGGRLRLWTGGIILPAALVLVSWTTLVPFPNRLGGAGGNIAFSLSTTPGDLGLFTAALMAPPPGFETDVDIMLRPRIAATPAIDWAAGIGRVDLPDGGLALWQWGGNPGVKGVMVALPERCEGLVVLTNGPKGDEVYRALSRAVLGVDPNWKVT